LIDRTGRSRAALAQAARLKRWVAPFAAAFLAAGTGRPIWAQSPQQIEKAAADAAKTLDLQLILPLEASKPPRWFWSWRLPDWLTDWRFRSLDSFDSALFWLILLAIAALAVYALRDALPFGRPRDGWQAADENGAQAGAQTPAEAALTAEDLARQGRYAEAMHVLLLRSLAEMRRRMGEAFADSLTSREILRRASLSDEGRGALRDIVIRVEWTYFGEHPASLSDYAACRKSYDGFIAALNGESAAGGRSGAPAYGRGGSGREVS
jgi:hypothetical protein